VVLFLISSLGIFVITAAICNKVIYLTNIWTPVYMLWYTREASVAVYVSNLPLIWPLLREWFPKLQHLSSGQRLVPRQAGHNNNGNVDGLSRSTRHLSTAIRGTMKGDSAEELNKGNAMGILTSAKSSEYGSDIYVAAVAGK
jgi:hypothetical protein